MAAHPRSSGPSSNGGQAWCCRATRTRTSPPPPTATATITRTATPEPLLVGHVTWQGRPAQPDPLQHLPVTLTLKLGGAEVNYPGQTTDANGTFTTSLAGLSPG